jgi:N-acetylmuramic acid 6-phosphate (MurNAc-6-P) etherase
MKFIFNNLNVFISVKAKKLYLNSMLDVLVNNSLIYLDKLKLKYKIKFH